MSDNRCPCCRELMLVIDALRAEIDKLQKMYVEQNLRLGNTQATNARLRAALEKIKNLDLASEAWEIARSALGEGE